MPIGSPSAVQALTAASMFALVTLLALAFRYLTFRALRRWASATGSPFSPLLLAGLRLPSLVWCVLIGLYVAIDTAEVPPRLSAAALKVLFSLLVISVTVAVANLSGAALREGMKQNMAALPGLSFTFIKVVIWITGGLVLLGGLGISITPVLTALGVGGLAVALALQDTLSNFFAGIHLLVEKPIRVGDFIKLETGQEGYVADIGWRTTRIRMLPNNMVIMPNSKLTQSVLTNYYLPEPRMSLLIPISVSYRSDPDHVERLLVEEATRAVGHIPGLLAEPPAFVRFIPGFGESSLDFTLICQVQEFTDQYLAQHELRKRIFKRFKEEGIEIPFPQRTVHLHAGGPSVGSASPTASDSEPQPPHAR
ncbi:mechanosensitive ion channel family protein [Candidatus Nitrospira bockiana]